MKRVFGLYMLVLAVLMMHVLGCRGVSVKGEDGHYLWLYPQHAVPVKILCSGQTAILSIAKQELLQNWRGKENATVELLVGSDKLIKGDGYKFTATGIQANTEAGILYGVYELLRRQQTNQPIQNEICNPSYEIRILNHWDNPDGSIERGYAGHSIFWRKEQDSMDVTSEDSIRWKEYARANASVGINGTVLNNVNASPKILSRPYLDRVKAIADVLRPYGIKTFLSVKFSSPSMLGGLKTSDPLNPEVIQWWKEKVKEIYSIIPDFGGFLVKANSEGQPGPQDFGRTHADGANMLADALKPFGGIVMWRAFVYSSEDKDRARQAYAEFMPLDGQFRDNVIIQVKNGPIDFQPREPFSPLFGAMKKTSVMPELQITQEYLGHSVQLVFLAAMWEELLKSDTYQEGAGSTVAHCTDGSIFPQKYSAIAGVANIGLDANWCGHQFAQANWYAFGRLAWNNQLTSEKIADEWLRLTFSASVDSLKPEYRNNWQEHFLLPVKNMMLKSREAAVDYMMPLGLHHIFAANHHYGPGPWEAPKGVRPDWTPVYYHKADTFGVGFDRTRTGSNAVSQYHEPLASLFNNQATCPEIYLLWFHHVSWTYRMNSGRSLWDELCLHYDTGLKQVRDFQKTWDEVQPYVDEQRFLEVQSKLREQYHDAQIWKDACILYFQQFSRLPIPPDVEQPVNKLEELMKIKRNMTYHN
jgi:alpha-glucuronidase